MKKQLFTIAILMGVISGLQGAKNVLPVIKSGTVVGSIQTQFVSILETVASQEKIPFFTFSNGLENANGPDVVDNKSDGEFGFLAKVYIVGKNGFYHGSLVDLRTYVYTNNKSIEKRLRAEANQELAKTKQELAQANKELAQANEKLNKYESQTVWPTVFKIGGGALLGAVSFKLLQEYNKA
jgi:hypothetical protein